MSNNYAERVQKLQSAYDKAIGIKGANQKTYDDLKVKYNDLIIQCKEEYGCEPKDLQKIIEQKESLVQENLALAEQKIQDLDNT